MKLPIIRSLTEKSAAELETTAGVLEHLSQARGLKPEELDVIGELLSNLFGAVEVKKSIEAGTPQAEALNGFMKRVMGSIDRS